MTDSIKVLRLRANESGLSSFDTIEIQRDMREFAPPAPLLYVSKPEPASGFVVLRAYPSGGLANGTRLRLDKCCFVLREKSWLLQALATPSSLEQATPGSWKTLQGAAMRPRSSRKNHSTRW